MCRSTVENPNTISKTQHFGNKLLRKKIPIYFFDTIKKKKNHSKYDALIFEKHVYEMNYIIYEFCVCIYIFN